MILERVRYDSIDHTLEIWIDGTVRRFRNASHDALSAALEAASETERLFAELERLLGEPETVLAPSP